MSQAIELLNEKAKAGGIGYKSFYDLVDENKKEYSRYMITFICGVIDELIKERDMIYDGRSNDAKEIAALRDVNTHLENRLTETLNALNGFKDQYEWAIKRCSELGNEIRKLDYDKHQLYIQTKKLEETINDIVKYNPKDHYPRWVDVKERLPKDENKMFFCKSGSGKSEDRRCIRLQYFNMWIATAWLEEEPQQKQDWKYCELTKNQQEKLRKEFESIGEFFTPLKANTVSEGNITDTTTSLCENLGSTVEGVILANKKVEEWIDSYPKIMEIQKNIAVEEWKTNHPKYMERQKNIEVENLLKELYKIVETVKMSIKKIQDFLQGGATI